MLFSISPVPGSVSVGSLACWRELLAVHRAVPWYKTFGWEGALHARAFERAGDELLNLMHRERLRGMRAWLFAFAAECYAHAESIAPLTAGAAENCR